MAATLSILMPTFNGARYIEEQVSSILAQSYADFDLLVLDDGSTDDTVAKIRRLAARDERVKLLDSQGGNKGQRSRLLSLLSAARSPAIAFSDQDDIWSERKIEFLMDSLEGCALAFGPSSLIDFEGRDVGMTLHEMARLPFKPHSQLQALFTPLVSAHATVMRRKAIAPLAFRTSLPFDWALTLDAQFSKGVVYVPEAVTSHRIHDANQNNGHLSSSLQARSVSSEIWLPRWAFRKGNLDRVMFFKRISYLAVSEIVAEDIRRNFSRLTSVVENAWFTETTSRHWRINKWCYAALRDGLRSFARDDGEWAKLDETLWTLSSSWRPRRMSRYIR